MSGPSSDKRDHEPTLATGADAPITPARPDKGSGAVIRPFLEQAGPDRVSRWLNG